MKDGIVISPMPKLKGMAALRVVLARLRYKDGWRFELTESGELYGTSAGSLTVTFPAEDAVNRGLHRDQGMTTSIPLYPDIDEATEEMWAEWLFGVILFIEIHEASEFFNLAGERGRERPFDPHPNQRLATEIAARGLPRHL